jgi:hypothetical protein
VGVIMKKENINKYEPLASPVEQGGMRFISRLVDRYLWAWRLRNLWRDRKLIIRSKLLDAKIKYQTWKIERLIKKGKNA